MLAALVCAIIEYRDYKQWNNYKLILIFSVLFVLYNSSLPPLTNHCYYPTRQPIVFVSDRARANKEIEHDGIQGEKKKKKVNSRADW